MPTAATPTTAMPAAAAKTASKAPAVEAAAMKTTAAAMKLSRGRRWHRGDRSRQSERGDGRNHGLLDRIMHGIIPPADRPLSPRLTLKLCCNGKSSRVSVLHPAKN
jgi:hypothetical protein